MDKTMEIDYYNGLYADYFKDPFLEFVAWVFSS